jgi:putative DNA primase/helicase
MSEKIQRLDDFLSLLKGVKEVGNGSYMALCSGHHDTKQSLSVKEVDGKILVNCFAGCELTDILKPLELEPKDLFLDSHEAKLEHREIEAIYHYSDANGKPFEVVRTIPKGFSQRRPNGLGSYINNLKGITPTLYHQDEVMAAIARSDTVYLVEGEKDADRLRSLGLIATTNPMGAGKWRNNYSEALRGADLIIISDNDKPGREHVNQVAKSCYGVAYRIRVLELPSESKDMSDWLDEGHTVDELMQLVDTCPDYEPSDNGVKLRCMADVKAESVSWLWQPYIPKGKLTLLEGDPGVGKSWVSLAIATAIVQGKGLPSQETSPPANVVIASAEDGLGDTIRPRLDNMGADVNWIFAIDGAITLDESGFIQLETYLEGIRPALLIIDPLVAYLGGDIDIHRANETRQVMARLARLAEKFDTAILAIRHLTKGGMAKSIYRGLGSIDFTAACRSVLLAGCEAENPKNRALVHHKSNLAPSGTSIGYELRNGGFYWTGESSLTVAQILAADSGDTTLVMDEAMAFLRDELASGPVPASQVFSDGKGAGLTEITIKRAKAKLGIVTRRQGEIGKRGGGRFTWELPDNHLEDQKDLEYQGYHIKENDTLNNSSLKNTPPEIGDDTLNHSNVPDYPTQLCHNCGSGDYWLTDWNQWLCSRCHPKPGGNRRK